VLQSVRDLRSRLDRPSPHALRPGAGQL